jgi:hypothetical protein
VKGRPFAFWLAVGGTSLMSLFGLNLAADRINSPGLREFRDYITRRNG